MLIDVYFYLNEKAFRIYNPKQYTAKELFKQFRLAEREVFIGHKDNFLKALALFGWTKVENNNEDKADYNYDRDSHSFLRFNTTKDKWDNFLKIKFSILERIKSFKFWRKQFKSIDTYLTIEGCQYKTDITLFSQLPFTKKQILKQLSKAEAEQFVGNKDNFLSVMQSFGWNIVDSRRYTKYWYDRDIGRLFTFNYASGKRGYSFFKSKKIKFKRRDKN